MRRHNHIPQLRTPKRKESSAKKRLPRAGGQLLLATLLLLAAARPAAAATIMATLPPLAGLVHMLQPAASVDCLLPANADPHHFQLAPRQIEQMRASSLLIRASRDDGAWPRLPVGGEALDLWPDDDHAWLSPAEVRARLPGLADKLAALADADTAARIRARLPEALAEVKHESVAWKKTLAPLRRSGVIVQHPAWQRLLDEYGVPVHAVLESRQHGQESGPHLLEHALEALKAHPQALLLGDSRHSNRALEWLARRSGKPILYLDALGTCDDSWSTLMRRNREQLRAAIP